MSVLIDNEFGFLVNLAFFLATLPVHYDNETDINVTNQAC